MYCRNTESLQIINASNSLCVLRIYKKRSKTEVHVERALTESYSPMETNLSQISKLKCLLLCKCKGVGEQCLEWLVRYKYYPIERKYFWNLNISNHTHSNAAHTAYHSPSAKLKDNYSYLAILEILDLLIFIMFTMVHLK